MNKANINFRILSPFGAEADPIGITDLQEPDIDAVKDTLANNGFIVFRKQSLSDADFVVFLNRLGQVTFTAGETPVLHQPDLNIVTNVGRVSPPRSVFHTDTSYISQPPAFTALRAVTVPVSGGATLFSDQYRAYETLPSSVKEQFAEAKVLHVVSGLKLGADLQTQSWHPLFQRHPISGRLALFLSTPERCQAISGIAPQTAHRIIRLLYKHSIRHYRVYRHQWQPEDTIVWDNRCTMHRADHSQVVGDRVLHRGLVLA
ncbi:TauD/TfdA dioxygenase family protein [Chamaesiphon sp.]|uniref:TauD/TfdA dioxygenase family protein n=1 Tax=Chamaesiphon sp. TaxID=2814140 RepID=UPI0035937288